MGAERKRKAGSPIDPLLKAVAARIEELYVAKGWKPADFARAANVTLPYLWRLREGQMNLTVRSLSRIAMALEVEMSALLEGVPADPATLPPRGWKPRARTGPKKTIPGRQSFGLEAEDERASDEAEVRDDLDQDE